MKWAEETLATSRQVPMEPPGPPVGASSRRIARVAEA